jgi:hypothetical protein
VQIINGWQYLWDVSFLGCYINILLINVRHLWNRRRKTTILDCFYAGLQPFLQKQRSPIIITWSILPLLLEGDYFTIVIVVKIWLVKVSTPHDAKLLLLRREELYQVELGTWYAQYYVVACIPNTSHGGKNALCLTVSSSIVPPHTCTSHCSRDRHKKW